MVDADLRSTPAMLTIRVIPDSSCNGALGYVRRFSAAAARGRMRHRALTFAMPNTIIRSTKEQMLTTAA
ncbi:MULTISPECIES: hypothetical protein [unclassified Caballeronia]|uniref:hypothetical protein n=1 Tax=unclassified Caballeronia TaxID=2646786 RepID=UPI001FD468C0|nr:MULTISPECIES: hypothetical protein [unclassified Caballeronia]MDR5802924.1 hypothetical protein [Caballeronia sp. LZ001]